VSESSGQFLAMIPVEQYDTESARTGIVDAAAVRINFDFRQFFVFGYFFRFRFCQFFTL
jgi:hypothetical protein